MASGTHPSPASSGRKSFTWDGLTAFEPRIGRERRVRLPQMEAHQLLQEQTRHHYRWLERAFTDFDEELACREPLVGRPSMTWQVTHLVEQVESTAEALCGWMPPAVPIPGAWNSLCTRFTSSAEGALRALAGLSADDLTAPPLVSVHPGLEEALSTRLQWWSGHVFHVAYHLGQIGSLRAALDLGWRPFTSDYRQDPPTGS